MTDYVTQLKPENVILLEKDGVPVFVFVVNNSNNLYAILVYQASLSFYIARIIADMTGNEIEHLLNLDKCYDFKYLEAEYRMRAMTGIFSNKKQVEDLVRACKDPLNYDNVCQTFKNFNPLLQR